MGYTLINTERGTWSHSSGKHVSSKHTSFFGIARHLCMVLEFILSKLTGKSNTANTDTKANQPFGYTYNSDMNDCYESTTTKEVCSTNEHGNIVCNRENQVWRICRGQKPVSLVINWTHLQGIDLKCERRRATNRRST
jgi:hypothetical protein